MAKNTENPGVVNENVESDNLKDCFIITPIGGDGSDTFIKADGLIKSVINPVLREFGYRALPAYQIDATGSITKQIIHHIYSDELVIANLTGNNPNVMYELAIRHAFGKKVISMAEKGTKLPFDISDQRTIFYEDTLSGSEAAKPRLESAIKAILANDAEQVSNPIFDAIKENAVVKSVDVGDQEVTKYVLDRLDRLERLIVDGRRYGRKPLFVPRDLGADDYRWTIEVNYSGSSALIEGEVKNLMETFSLDQWKIHKRSGSLLIINFSGRHIEARIVGDKLMRLQNVNGVELIEHGPAIDEFQRIQFTDKIN